MTQKLSAMVQLSHSNIHLMLLVPALTTHRRILKKHVKSKLIHIISQSYPPSSVAPFNAMRERKLADTTENPGPGSYAAEPTKVVATVKDMMSNSFSTKVSSQHLTHLICSNLDPSFLPYCTWLIELQPTIIPD